MPELSARDRAVLAFERTWWTHSDAKDDAVRDRLDLSPQEYYQALNALLDRPEALELDPLLVRRLRRQRLVRQRQRQERRQHRS